MQRVTPAVALILSSLFLTACGPEVETNDPVRVEFVDACDGLRAYNRMEANDRINMCKCLYDTALQGLSDEEKDGARFYLLEQSGIDARSRNLVKKPDMSVMLAASKAVGDAVKECPAR